MEAVRGWVWIFSGIAQYNMSPLRMVLEPKCQKCSYGTEPRKSLWFQTVHKCVVKLNRIILL